MMPTTSRMRALPALAFSPTPVLDGPPHLVFELRRICHGIEDLVRKARAKGWRVLVRGQDSAAYELHSALVVQHEGAPALLVRSGRDGSWCAYVREPARFVLVRGYGASGSAADGEPLEIFCDRETR